LTGLTSLGLSRNRIRDEGARALSTLTGLTALDLSINWIGDEGARALSTLTGLALLDLSRNRIGDEGARALLDAWADAEHPVSVTRLGLRENRDLSAILPPEVLDTDDAQAILAAYRRFRGKTGLRPLNEAKLLVVGEEASGKTSLIRFLTQDQPRDRSEQRTSGIRTFEKIETRDWSPEAGGIRLNVWDFGGQEIMRGTHRFFLTERSLYLLVLENRRADDLQKVHEWLKTIAIRGKKPPVIVVINKCDLPYVRNDDEAGLQARYPNIVAFVRTSCNRDEASRAGITDLRHLIGRIIAGGGPLEHVTKPTPESWLRVKIAVRDLAREHSILTLRAFQDICEEGDSADDRVTDPDEQRALLRLLHDLGTVVAHGFDRDAPAVRREITLLDPNWLTEAIYPVLDKAAANPVPGEFARSDLAAWLDPRDYPPDRHEFILDRMMDPAIGLAAPLPGSNGQRFLVPRALPASAPYYENWPADSIRFRYTYDLLPDALFPRFIVEAHHELADPPTRWQTGAVLEIEGCPVLVRADRPARQIDVLVDGRAGRGREALAVVRRHLKTVHAQFPETTPEARVPLPDQPETDVSFEHLQKLEEKYGTDHAYLPEGAQREHTVRELLEGVRLTYNAEEDLFQSTQHYHIAAGKYAQVTFVGRDIAADHGSTQTVGTQTAPIGPQPSPDPPPPPKDTWPWLAAGCGLAAMIAAGVLIPFDWSAWRLAAGSLIGLGIAVGLFVLSLNPRRYFRWALSAWLPLGPLHAAGVTLALGAETDAGSSFFRLDAQPSPTFLVVWVLVVLALIAADLYQQHRHGP
ncbi:MAG: GTP-binding protein, partial [Alphaproteobacteria bacterium]|nr:GTP-binding protein [Alphaproteobacteria bacterium]